MIIIDGYSKDPGIMPEGITVTWGRELIQEKSDPLVFILFFELTMADERAFWL